ncbi:MAG: hypothetical protein WHS89_11050 [Acidimicrobiales bacterium]|jgi:hypothetical protein
MASKFEKRARRIRRVVRRWPVVEPLVSRAGAALWRRHLRRQVAQSHAGVDPSRLLWVDPAKVHWRLRSAAVRELIPGSTRSAIGQVLGGDWDRDVEPIDAHPFIAAARERYVEGKAWDDTDFAAQMRERIEREGPQHRYRTPEDIARLGKRWDELADHIRTQGYRSQDELGTGKPWEEVLVAFDRVGRVIFVEGVHRFAIARALGVEQIPVRVAVRHQDWYRFSGEVRAYVNEVQGGRAYQPLLHPDLADVPFSHDGERFDLILDALPVREGRLLDIGANWGYFCHRFEEVGFTPVASERSEKQLYFLTGLRDALERRFDIWGGSITEVKDLGEFDVVLALNVFHHFLKSESSYLELLTLLRRLRARYLVFEPHLPDERQMQRAYRNPGPDEFRKLVQQETGLTGYSQIGTAGHGRPIYLLHGGS